MNPPNIVQCDVVMPSTSEMIAQYATDNIVPVIVILVLQLVAAAVVAMVVVSRKKRKKAEKQENDRWD